MSWKDLRNIRWKDIRNLDRADVLERIGLEERSPMGDFFSGLGLFAVGVLVGAGLGLMFAPKPGAEMRNQVSDAIRKRGQHVAEEYGQHLGMENQPGRMG